MRTNAEINEYLALEFGLEEENRIPGDDWPFHLSEVGHLASGTRVLEFSDRRERFWLLEGASLTYLPVEDADFRDLEFEEVGRSWIASREPVDLSTSLLGDANVPRTIERKQAIADLARAATGLTDIEIREGLFLRRTAKYLALVATAEGLAVVGAEVPFIPARAVSTSAPRNLCVAIGEWLRRTGENSAA